MNQPEPGILRTALLAMGGVVEPLHCPPCLEPGQEFCPRCSCCWHSCEVCKGSGVVNSAEERQREAEGRSKRHRKQECLS